MKKILHFIGKSKVGKTTLIEKLLGEFKQRGFRVSVLKTTLHQVELDLKGKDSFRFAASGAESTGLISPESTYLFKKRAARDFEELSDFMLKNSDFLLVEGYPESAYPKILVSGKGDKAGLNLIGVVSEAGVGEGCELPVFAPNQIKRLADFILENLDFKPGEVV